MRQYHATLRTWRSVIGIMGVRIPSGVLRKNIMCLKPKIKKMNGFVRFITFGWAAGITLSPFGIYIQEKYFLYRNIKPVYSNRIMCYSASLLKKFLIWTCWNNLETLELLEDKKLSAIWSTPTNCQRYGVTPDNIQAISDR